MAERYIPEHRRTQFKAKNTFKPEELRRRREEQQVEIRKAKREENLAKRRGIGTGENRPGASLGAAPDSDDESAPTESQVCASAFFLSPLLSVLHGLGTSSKTRLPAHHAVPPAWRCGGKTLPYNPTFCRRELEQTRLMPTSRPMVLPPSPWVGERVPPGYTIASSRSPR
ncbi:importin beta binding domain-containing protein [Ilyonectria robusta]|uniref:importin beta binding domain-containing protein n=1 Tax=Ilyonectria robusta TaxID=1079257 RepID=UPI001E8D6BA5|nr:importin beta binding domain-containing protein [Ilyonectria robusta]KAH8733381.1 importin beta binding domain-containing protein [Ilyonectria robusta]